jgi:nicotinamide riboside kinase
MDSIFKGNSDVRISVSGVQSSGKTTILQQLKTDSNISSRFKFIEKITRNIKNKGLDINNQGIHYDTTQLLIMAGHIENSLNDNIILDRCALDGLAYTTYLYKHKKVQQWVLDYAIKVFEKLQPIYDIIFITLPEFGIENDGTRSIDKNFRDEMVEIFDNIIVKYKLFVVYLSGSVEERTERIKKQIEYLDWLNDPKTM